MTTDFGTPRDMRIPAPMISSSGCAATTINGSSAPIAAGHSCAEIAEFFRTTGWTGVMGAYTAVLRRETKRDGYVEILQSGHLAVEPRIGIGPEAVGPTE